MKATVEKVCFTMVFNMFKKQVCLLEGLVIDVQNNQPWSVPMEYCYAAISSLWLWDEKFRSDLGSFRVGCGRLSV